MILKLHVKKFKHFTSLGFSFIDGACPASDPAKLLHRMENTRFYIIHGKDRGNFTDWAGAYGECEKHGLKLAKVKNMLTMAVVGRALERHVEKHQLKDTFCKWKYMYIYVSNIDFLYS